jgi:hypothetical protein
MKTSQNENTETPQQKTKQNKSGQKKIKDIKKQNKQ